MTLVNNWAIFSSTPFNINWTRARLGQIRGNQRRSNILYIMSKPLDAGVDLDHWQWKHRVHTSPHRNLTWTLLSWCTKLLMQYPQQRITETGNQSLLQYLQKCFSQSIAYPKASVVSGDIIPSAHTSSFAPLSMYQLGHHVQCASHNFKLSKIEFVQIFGYNRKN